MADRVKKIADSRGDGVSDIVREALEKYISTLKA
jgi:predicted DNA-binding protein